MPRVKKTNENITWEYEFPLPTLNIQSDFRTQTPGTFSRLAGVDGRYKGRLRRFPGWKLVEDLSAVIGSVTIGGFDGLNLNPTFTPFAIQLAPNSNQIVQGVLFLGELTGQTRLFAFQSLDGAAPTLETVHNFSTSFQRPAVLDVTTDNQLVYIVGEDTRADPRGIELLARYTGTVGAWKASTWPQAFKTENIKTEKFPSTAIRNESNTVQLDPGYLETNGEVGVSIRVVFPEQGFVTPLSAPTVFKADPDHNSVLGTAYPSVFLGLRLEMGDIQTLGDVFSSARIQVFRTVEQSDQFQQGSVPGAEPVLGQLFLEAEWEIPRQTGSLVGTFDYRSGYNAGANVITSDGSVGTLTAGDTLYFTYPIRTNGAKENANDATGAFAYVVFKRKVTSVVGQVITFSPVGPPRDPGSLTIGARWWGSRSGDETDSSGAFVDIGNLDSDSDCYVGWRPASEIAGVGDPEVVRWPSDMPRGLEDVALAIQPRLTPAEFAIFDPTNPPTSQIEEYEGLFVRVTRAGGLNVQTSGRDVLRWENPSLTRKGLVPIFNRRILTDLTDAVIGFVKADPFLVAALNNGLLRIHRSGNRLAVDPIHNRFGAIGVNSMVSVGTNLYVASETGILLVDLLTGRVDALNATQHFFDETGSRWRDDLSSVESAYDAPTASLIFLNPVKFECIIIWLNHGVFTHLIDVPFDNVVSMGAFRTGGLRRAMFYNSVAGKFYEIDANRSEANRTTVGGVATQTFNGIGGVGTNASTLAEGAGETFTNSVVGHFIRFHDSPDVIPRDKVRITAFNSGSPNTYTFSPTFGGTPPNTGSRYSIGAIPMLVTAWPLSGDSEQPILDMFRVKTVDSMGVVAVDNSRILDPVHDLVKYQIFERSDSPNAVDTTTKDQAVAVDTNQANLVSIKRTHSMLVPGFEFWSSDQDISMLGMVATGRILGTTQDKRT